jgi:ComF family protein
MNTVPLSFTEKLPQILAIFESPTLIPVPLHKNRLKKRGFNQADIMGKHLSDLMKISFNQNVVIRSRDTISQAKITDSKKRHKNMIKAFTLVSKSFVQGNSIILFDDVFTTGSTLFEIVKLLKQNNCKKVYAITFARSL